MLIEMLDIRNIMELNSASLCRRVVMRLRRYVMFVYDKNADKHFPSTYIISIGIENKYVATLVKEE